MKIAFTILFACFAVCAENVKFTWDESPGAASYRLLWGPTWYPTAVAATVTAPPATVNVPTNTIYYFQVVAVGSNGAVSAPSNMIFYSGGPRPRVELWQADPRVQLGVLSTRGHKQRIFRTSTVNEVCHVESLVEDSETWERLLRLPQEAPARPALLMLPQ